jgi:polyferredoxin
MVRCRLALGEESLVPLPASRREALIGMACPLTVWEDALRGGARADSFVGRWVRQLLFYQAPEWIFTAAYAAWAAASALTLVLVPPTRKAA